MGRSVSRSRLLVSKLRKRSPDGRRGNAVLNRIKRFSLRSVPVETSQAGPGNLEVTVNGGRVPTTAQGQGPHTYAISFTPRQAVAHTVDLRFNGKDVPGTVQDPAFVQESSKRI